MFIMWMIHHSLLNCVKEFIGRKHSRPSEAVGICSRTPTLKYQNLWLVEPLMIPSGHHLHITYMRS